MTTASPASAGDPARRAFIARATHSMPVLGWAYMLLSTPAYLGWEPVSTVAFFPWLVVFILMIATMVHAARAGLCLDCARRTPTDPQAAIDKHRWALFATHVAAHRPILSWAWLIGVGVLGYVAVAVTDVRWFYAVFDLVLVSLFYAEWRHHYLQPWCPRCRGGWGDGGHPEVVPEPDPVGRGER